ncbi:MAG: DeoR/GlpR transcriptional regulator [Ruminococcaceae bacterium]|nr:DeoR/GlpR transcriptional regulator [Oscillospiraceae bacterium]
MKQDRLQALMGRLSIVRTMSLAEAMELLDVSESTARRMFAELEYSGAAIRTHGGICCVDRAPTAYSFEFGAKLNIDKKAAIGAAACDFLDDGDVIFCDSGTTIQCFCAELVHRLRRDKLNIKVYTNSLANLELLSPYIPVHLVGGEYRANRKDFCGHMAEQALKSVYFTKSFVGADGCVDADMFTTTDFETMRMNEIAMDHSMQSYMLVDSSKFALSSHVAYAPVSRISTIITDNEISREILEKLQKTPANIVCVDVNQI